MTATAESPDRAEDARRTTSPARLGLIAVLCALLALVLWGGYSRRWPWTGINGHTATLWDWLHLLLLPIAVGILPIWVSRRSDLRRPHKLASAGVAAALALLIVGGYAIPWAWTGFTGNKLWDWLELLALPVAVALIPTFSELRRRWTSRQTAIALCTLGTFAIVVLGGYLAGWSWTGFEGNTLWDWMHLLLLPLLLPTVIVPLLMPMATAGLIAGDQQDPELTPDDGASAQPSGGPGAEPAPATDRPSGPGPDGASG